ncbi:hypothetical protein K503DRAFT_773539, partial [Rhizopogon vinicolor AM-OR11-026]
MFYPLLGSRQATRSAYALTIDAGVLPRANPARPTGRTAEVLPQQSPISNVFSYIEPRVVPSAYPIYHTETMRHSFLVIIAAFTASMSV